MRIAGWRLLAAVSMGCATQAMAQGAFEPRVIDWQFAGGYSITTGTTKDFLDNGWMLNFGLTWNPQPGGPWGVLGEIHYSSYSAMTTSRPYGSWIV